MQVLRKSGAKTVILDFRVEKRRCFGRGVAAMSDNLNAGGPAAQRTPRWLLALLLAGAFVPLLALLAWHANLYAWLCDDAFISFRYVRNLVGGHGIVYNRGERVEGYTNFLWVLELAAIWKALGVRPEDSANILSSLFTAGVLGLTARLAWRTPYRGRRWAAVWIALALLAVNRSFAVWATSGLETRQFTFFIVAAVLLLRRHGNRAAPAALASLCMAGAEYTRPEGMLLWACGLGWLLADGLFRRRFPLRAAVAYALPYALLVTAHYAFRIWYYGEVFPNTYYAKVVRPWPEAGMQYLVSALIEHGAVLVLPFALAGMVTRIGRRRDSTHLLSFALIIPHALYLIRIGGDHFEFRPFDFHWPLLAVAAADGALALARRTRSLFRGRRHAGRAAEWSVLGGLTAVLAAYTGVLGVGKYFVTYEKTTRAETLMMFVPLTEKNFASGYLLPLMPTLIPIYNGAMGSCISHSIGTSHQEHKVLWQTRVREWGPYEEISRRGLLPKGCISVEALAGIMPYYMADLTVIDILGLNDKVVARSPVERKNSERQLAHDRKADFAYMMRRGVNINILGAETNRRSALLKAEFALRVNDNLWMPFDAFSRKWVKDTFGDRPVYQARTIRVLGDFENGSMDGWTTSGAAFEGQPRTGPVAGEPKVQMVEGKGFLDSWDPVLGPGATGAALSPAFTAPPGAALRFKFAGGNTPAVGVEVLCDGKRLKSWVGRFNWFLRYETFLLPENLCREFRVRVFDEGKGPDGFVLADRVTLVDFPEQPGVFLEDGETSGPRD